MKLIRQIKNVNTISQVKMSHIANILDITNALWQVSWCISIIITADKLKIY